MLEKLTKEQEKNLEVWKNKWLSIGLDTKPCDREEAERWMKEAYKVAGLKPPGEFIWVLSPMQAQTKANEINGNKKFVYYYSGFGALDANWLGFYDYFDQNTKVKTEKIRPLINLAYNCGWWIGGEDVCIMSEKPEQIHFNANKVLHNETGPSIRYRDGFELYHLNGVRLSKEIVMTPREKLDCKLILKEKNVEVRRELIRKIGMERIGTELVDKVLDTWNNYELLLVNFGERKVKYLKMVNPSIGTFHIEGVENTCNTVKEALAWRNGLEEYIEPAELT